MMVMPLVMMLVTLFMMIQFKLSLFIMTIRIAIAWNQHEDVKNDDEAVS